MHGETVKKEKKLVKVYTNDDVKIMHFIAMFSLNLEASV
jgi:hypothetical protein